MDRLPPELIEQVLQALAPPESEYFEADLLSCVSLSKSISPVALLLLYRSVRLFTDHDASRLVVAPAFGTDEFPTLKLVIFGNLYEGVRNEKAARVLSKCTQLVELTLDGFEAMDARLLQNPALQGLQRLHLDTRIADYNSPLVVPFSLQSLWLADTPIPPSLLTAIYSAFGPEGLPSLRIEAPLSDDPIQQYSLGSIFAKLRTLRIDAVIDSSMLAPQLTLITTHCPVLVELYIGLDFSRRPHEMTKLEDRCRTLHTVTVFLHGASSVDDEPDLDAVLQSPPFEHLRRLRILSSRLVAGGVEVVTPYWARRLDAMEATSGTIERSRK